MIRPKVHGGSLGFNTTTPAGRAVQHLLDRSPALRNTREQGWDIAVHDDNGRSLVVHPQFAAWCSDGEAALLLFAESLLDRTAVRIGWILDTVDEDERHVILEAVAVAAGFEVAEVAA